MVIFMYTDSTCEHQAISCIKTLLPRLRSNDTILYYTVGFESSFESENLRKIKFDLTDYPTFHYYKAELSLLTMELYPEEEHFFFTDTDILYSKRFNPANLEHDFDYPLASFGPYQHPYKFEVVNGERKVYDEGNLMRYLGVPHQLHWYVWSCIFSYNRKCTDFLEEYTSLCKNKYLLDRREDYYPFHDETPFNVCLYKRNGHESLGFAFVNTSNPATVELVENARVVEWKNEETNGWEYVQDSDRVIAYHGFKEKSLADQAIKKILG